MELGRLPDPDTPRAASLYPATVGETDRTVRKWKQNGAWLDQGPYGTCVGNAFGHRRADGPVPIPGIDELWAQKLYLEASAIYWGVPDTTMKKGTSARSAGEVLLKRGAIDRYEWITTPEGLRYTLLEVGSVCLGIDWYTSMDNPKLVMKGDAHAYYITQDRTTVKRGGHELLINGIDLAPADGMDPYVRLKNSWGTTWGAHGTARMRLAEIEELVSLGWVDLALIHELPRLAA
jgi:hypothetical protein